jgi:hypothetical protein
VPDPNRIHTCRLDLRLDRAELSLACGSRCCSNGKVARQRPAARLWIQEFESFLGSHAPPSYDAVFSDSAVAGKVLILLRVSTPATHRRQPETPNTGCGARTAAGSPGPVFESSHVEHCARSARRQASASPRSRRYSCQSCGRFLESIASRAGVSSTGCWPTKIAPTISGERYERRPSTAT